MVIFYLLTNMSSPNDYIQWGLKKFFFAKFYFCFINKSNHGGDEIILRTREQGKQNT